MQDKTLSPSEISVLYDSAIRSHVKAAVHSCLAVSNNPYNRYELLQCVAIALTKDLTTASKSFRPDETDIEFIRRWTKNLVASYEAHERHKQMIGNMLQGKQA